MGIRKFLLLLTFTLQLSACGFTPMYGTGNSNVTSQLDNVEIAIIPDRSGQYLRNALIDRFYKNGYPNDAAYNLQINPIVERISDFDITVESEATRQQIKLSTTLSLIDKKNGEVVLKQNLTAITSNNILESEFSTLITEQSARDAALNDLARQIERQLALYFSSL